MQNGASFGAEVAFNTLITLKGRDFAPSGTRRSPGIPDFRNGFPKEMACVAVEVAGQRIPLTYVQADQINAQLPTSIGTGSMQFRVILNPDRPNQLVSDTGTFTVLNYAPAFFTFNGRSVAAVFPDGTIAADPSVVAGARTVKAGDVLQLYATGLGPTEPVWQAGETPSRASALRDRLSITCGGVTVSAADITYAGIVPGSISGLYQINVRVPSTVAEGEIPVTMTVGGVTSPAGTTIPVRR
ncbi:MAG: hypothetical protein H7Y20_09275 [Bryobacteraceae bacterium]|nr:hypothetical protein [Bryobacteraceae bacterium]